MSVPTKDLKFIHITKTAGTSIETVGLDNNIRWGINHKEYGFWHESFLNKPQGLKEKYDWFMVVRNPYDRILSEYAFITRVLEIPKNNVQGFNKFLKKWITNASENRESHPTFGRVGGDHFTEQYKYLDRSVNVRVLKFENIEAEFNELMKEYNLPVRLNKKIMVSHNKQFTINDITKETMELINTVYKRDFEEFGYSMLETNFHSEIKIHSPEPIQKKELKLIAITRTATPAIEETGLTNGLRWGENHKEYGWQYEIFQNKSQSFKEKYDWFMVVRNHYDRILSEYDFLMKALQTQNKHSVDHFNSTINKWINNIVSGVENHPKFGRVIGDHFTQQYKYFDPNIKIKILKYETLQEDFNAFMKESGFSFKLNTTKLPINDTTFTMDDISPENMQLINSVYANDFELFGYELHSYNQPGNHLKELKFIHATRSAGTSIEQAGLEQNKFWGRFHREYGHFDEPFINKPQELKTQYDWFMVVRNPYDRILSEYSLLAPSLKIANPSNKDVFNTFLTKWLINIQENVVNNQTYKYHLIPYSQYIDPNITINVLKYENIKNDFSKLMRLYNYPITLTKKSCSSKRIVQIKDISEYNIQLIKNVYSEDFRQFKYCVDP